MSRQHQGGKVSLLMSLYSGSFYSLVQQSRPPSPTHTFLAVRYLAPWPKSYPFMSRVLSHALLYVLHTPRSFICPPSLGRRGIAIFPHVAICDEKYKSWKAKFGSEYPRQPLCLKLGAFYGAASGTSWSGRFDLSICTAEKANSILNRLLLDSPLGSQFLKHGSKGPQDSLIYQIKKSVSRYAALAHPIEAIGTFAVDEVHEIADPRRYDLSHFKGAWAQTLTH